MYFLSTNQMKQGADIEKIKATIPQHIRWMKQQISEGNLVQAGKWGPSGGMCIIRSEGREEAEEILVKDPLIKEGLTDYLLDEFFPDVPLNPVESD